MYQLLYVLLGFLSKDAADAQLLSEDGEILSDHDDDDDFESLDKLREESADIEYEVPVWRPLVSFSCNFLFKLLHLYPGLSAQSFDRVLLNQFHRAWHLRVLSRQHLRRP